MLSDKKILKYIKTINNNYLSSFSFKILIGQLRTYLECNKDSDSEKLVIKKFNEFIKKYGHLESVKKDLDKYFN